MSTLKQGVSNVKEEASTMAAADATEIELASTEDGAIRNGEPPSHPDSADAAPSRPVERATARAAAALVAGSNGGQTSLQSAVQPSPKTTSTGASQLLPERTRNSSLTRMPETTTQQTTSAPQPPNPPTPPPSSPSEALSGTLTTPPAPSAAPSPPRKPLLVQDQNSTPDADIGTGDSGQEQASQTGAGHNTHAPSGQGDLNYEYGGGGGGDHNNDDDDSGDVAGDEASLRHTRVYGGGVCLACLEAEGGGGEYGERVPMEDRRQ